MSANNAAAKTLVTPAGAKAAAAPVGVELAPDLEPDADPLAACEEEGAAEAAPPFGVVAAGADGEGMGAVDAPSI